MDRRRFIVAGAWIGAAVFTGCSGGDNGPTTTEGEGDQTTEPETTTEPEGTTTEPKTTTEAEETTTESEETTEAKETTTEPETTTDEETTTEEGPGEEISFGGLYTIEKNYAADIEIYDPEATAEVRYYGDDYYQRYEDAEGNVVEIYHVDGDDYAVINGDQCFEDPGESVTPDSEAESDAEEYGSKPDIDLEPSGTDVIDYEPFYVDEPVYVFEVSGPDVEGVLIFYVSESTGYPLRIEADWGVINFHSWGEVDPISPPDMDCQQYPG